MKESSVFASRATTNGNSFTLRLQFNVIHYEKEERKAVRRMQANALQSFLPPIVETFQVRVAQLASAWRSCCVVLIQSHGDKQQNGNGQSKKIHETLITCRAQHSARILGQCVSRSIADTELAMRSRCVRKLIFIQHPI